MPNISLGTVYRNLKTLTEMGEILNCPMAVHTVVSMGIRNTTIILFANSAAGFMILAFR